MSGMTSGVCVESDLTSMLQRSSAPSHHHPNHHGYGGQGQVSSLAPMLDYTTEMDRYRSSIANFYKTNVNMNMNVTNFPQSAKLAARLAAATPIFPPAAARLGAMATGPWGCPDNMNMNHPATMFWGRPKPVATAPTHHHHHHPSATPGHMTSPHPHSTSMHPGGDGAPSPHGPERKLPSWLQRRDGLRRHEQAGTRPRGHDGSIRGRQLQRGRGDGQQLPGGAGITPRGHRHGDGVGRGRDLRRQQRLSDDGRPAGANGLPAARQLLPLPLVLLALVVGGDGGGRVLVVLVVLVVGHRGEEEEEAVRRVRAVQAPHQLRRLLILPQQEDGSPDLQVQEVRRAEEEAGGRRGVGAAAVRPDRRSFPVVLLASPSADRHKHHTRTTDNQLRGLLEVNRMQQDYSFTPSVRQF